MFGSFLAPCAVVRPWEAIVIGIIGGLLAVGGTRLMDRMHVDDPIGAVAVHGIGGIWVKTSGLHLNIFFKEWCRFLLNTFKIELFLFCLFCKADFFYIRFHLMQV